ncbi:MarR family transcriptional regulator [Halorutilales archaeon Cl-col2-1]
MPIGIDEFEHAPEKALGIDRDTNQWQVVEFLLENRDKAFTPKEIESEVGIPQGSAGVILSRLEEKGIVRHKGKYWAVERDDRLAGITSMVASTRSANETLGEEEIDEWTEHAEEDVKDGL